MNVTESVSRSGSRALDAGWVAPAEREWQEAAAIEQEELGQLRRSWPSAAGWLGLLEVGVLAGLLPAVYPFSPGYSASNTHVQIVGAAVVSLVAIAVVPLVVAEFWPRVLGHLGSSGMLLYGAALFSASAAAIHFAVVKMHFDEYTLFGVFFVLAGIAQLAWALLVTVWPARWLFAAGALGNLPIVALWAVDRIWGLPLGPQHWKPDPVGFGDVTASLVEVMLVVSCLLLLRRNRHRRTPAPGRRLAGSWAAVLTAAVVAVTALGLLSVMGVGSPVITPSM